MDRRTMEYSKLHTQRFKAEFGDIDTRLKREVEALNETRTVLESRIEGMHLVNLCTREDKYCVTADGKDVYTTADVIQWIETGGDLRRIAIFESSGSDSGTLKILTDGKLSELFEGNITQLVFTHDSYYTVRTFVENPPPDGGELNSHRVLRGGHIVFGSGLKPSEFIHICPSGDKALITVGDWNHSTLYVGELEDPSTWKELYALTSPAKPLGVREGEACYLERKGNGIIRKGTQAVVEGKTAIEDCVIVREGFLALHLRDAKVVPVLYDFGGKKLREFNMDVPMGLRSTDSDGANAVINLQSFGIPYAIYMFREGGLHKLEENRLLDLTVRDRWVNSSGTDIHYFLVSKPRQRKRKVVAYGYGGYNVSLFPAYSPLFAILLKRGVRIVQANLRGGGEYGEGWHRAGIREKKQNVFDDFISVISSLKKEGYTVVAMGESNGGLLVGSVLTQRPELLDGAVIGVPVLDMMRFHMMSVGKYWTTEYGNPDDPDDAMFLYEYSPYHNIRDESYPTTLLYARSNDDRVHPAHAIKFHMELDQKGKNAYLRIATGGGHAGMPIREREVEICENFNFISRCLNM